MILRYVAILLALVAFALAFAFVALALAVALVALALAVAIVAFALAVALVALALAAAIAFSFSGPLCWLFRRGFRLFCFCRCGGQRNYACAADGHRN